ncbi:hypothetical protein [Rhizobacter sp. OV335]|uniref:hypothetical protein n=1 Tax=Rhizobacter sp. OV335 TaxID=1500264 RepID=UPI00090F79E2|nr:hypothetical protein [Rhizobacter sp. OV335]SHN12233.1 hypothetical protein SAMN02787076_03449 [Rhizobacter sp. OV335]
MRALMRSCGESVSNRLTQAPAEEERNPPPFTLMIRRQLDNARACLDLNIPSDPTIIKASIAGTIAMATLAAALMLRMDMIGADGDRQDDVKAVAAERLSAGSFVAMLMAAFSMLACLHATARHCLSDSPPADVPAEDA